MPEMRSPRRIGLVAVALAAPALASPLAPATLDEAARGYVELALAIGEHDANYVDAYYGPEETRAKVRAAKADLGALARRASELVTKVRAVPRPSEDTEAGLLALRRDYLLQQVESAAARIDLLRGRRMRFDEESRALYNAVAPRHEAAYFQEKLDRIAALLDALPAAPDGRDLPADAPLRDRVERVRARVTIPPERIAAVFDRAIAECRARTAARVALPEGESFTVEPVTDKPWGAYNWYKGGYRSVIQVNVSLPIRIDAALQLACHEGYPGHHLYNALLEHRLVRDRGWREFQIYALFSPQSLIAEGTANYGVALAFPAEERLAFERDVLYPLAGLDPMLAAPYSRLRELTEELSYAGNEAARRYLDGEISAADAAAWLERYALFSPERAAQRVRFFDSYRSYV
ncbi:MAG TPA: hypothetical protein VFM88_23525, partial [Vicinamibacteria bacterium]|nr:hypothetical protein [Vicinamibacteria bacterium]